MDKAELRLELRARLLRRTGLGFDGWGKKKYRLSRGYVGVVLRRHLGKDERPRRWTKALEVIEGLEKETGLTLCG